MANQAIAAPFFTAFVRTRRIMAPGQAPLPSFRWNFVPLAADPLAVPVPLSAVDILGDFSPRDSTLPLGHQLTIRVGAPETFPLQDLFIEMFSDKYRKHFQQAGNPLEVSQRAYENIKTIGT
jgi:hypothetical protein